MSRMTEMTYCQVVALTDEEMELANIVTDHILGMLPEANEALVRAAVLRNVDLGESNYDFILEQAINTYLEHGITCETGLLSNQQTLRGAYGDDDENHQAEEDIQEQAKQTPTDAQACSLQNGGQETESVPHDSRFSPVSRFSNNSCEDDVETSAALPYTSYGYLNTTLCPFQDTIDGDKDHKILTASEDIYDEKPAFCPPVRSKSSADECGGKNIVEMHQNISVGNSDVGKHVSSRSVQHVKMKETQEEGFGLDYRSNWKYLSPETVSSEIEENIRLTTMTSFTRAGALNVDNNGSEDSTFVDNLDEIVNNEHTDNHQDGNKITDDFENDDWPILISCRRAFSSRVSTSSSSPSATCTPMISSSGLPANKIAGDKLRKKEAYIDLTVDDEDLTVNMLPVQTDVKPDIEMLNQHHSLSGDPWSHNAINFEINNNSSLTNSSSPVKKAQGYSDVNYHNSPGCSFWPDAIDRASSSKETNAVTTTNIATVIGISGAEVTYTTCSHFYSDFTTNSPSATAPSFSSTTFSSNLRTGSIVSLAMTAPTSSSTFASRHRTGSTVSLAMTAPTSSSTFASSHRTGATVSLAMTAPTSSSTFASSHRTGSTVSLAMTAPTSSSTFASSHRTGATVSLAMTAPTSSSTFASSHRTGATIVKADSPSVTSTVSNTTVASNFETGSTVVYTNSLAMTTPAMNNIFAAYDVRNIKKVAAYIRANASDDIGTSQSRKFSNDTVVTSSSSPHHKSFQLSVTATPASAVVISGNHRIGLDGEAISTKTFSDLLDDFHSASTHETTVPLASNNLMNGPDIVAVTTVSSALGVGQGFGSIMTTSSVTCSADSTYIARLMNVDPAAGNSDMNRNYQNSATMEVDESTLNQSLCFSSGPQVTVPSSVITTNNWTPAEVYSLITNQSAIAPSCIYTHESSAIAQVTSSTDGSYTGDVTSSSITASFGAAKRKSEASPSPVKRAKLDHREGFVRTEAVLDSAMFQPSFSSDEVGRLSEYPVSEANTVEEVQCDVCRRPDITEESVICEMGHIICKLCLEDEISQVIDSDKIHVSCPRAFCEEHLNLNALSALLPSYSYKMLERHITQKQEAATTRTIQQLGVMRCPLCPFETEIDEGSVVFQCANEKCKMICCRFCKSPWVNNTNNHGGCPILQYAGTGCFEDLMLNPANWSTSDNPGQRYVSVDVQLDSKEGKAVHDYFSQSSKRKVTKISRIQNRTCWEKFALKRKHMLEANGETELREKFLFHGTGKANVDIICSEGFDTRKQSVNGNRFGKANYFSTVASYSEKYARGSRAMFLTRVLCGLYTVGNSDDTHPPYANGRMYDSCVDNLENPLMYMVYANDQCYPEYVIHFR